MRGVGTGEPWFRDDMTDILGAGAVSVNYRKPLRLDPDGGDGRGSPASRPAVTG